MKDKEFIQKISILTRLRQKDVHSVLQAVADFLPMHFASNPDGEVYLRGLGSFKVRLMKDRKYYNPVSKRYESKSYYRTFFRQSVLFKQRLRYFMKQRETMPLSEGKVDGSTTAVVLEEKKDVGEEGQQDTGTHDIQNK